MVENEYILTVKLNTIEDIKKFVEHVLNSGKSVISQKNKLSNYENALIKIKWELKNG